MKIDVHFANLICQVTKWKIYTAKCQKKEPKFQSILNELLFIKKLESQSATSDKSKKKYEIKWEEKHKK